jgi:hypothetical protein
LAVPLRFASDKEKMMSDLQAIADRAETETRRAGPADIVMTNDAASGESKWLA